MIPPTESQLGGSTRGLAFRSACSPLWSAKLQWIPSLFAEAMVVFIRKKWHLTNEKKGDLAIKHEDLKCGLAT